MNESEKKTYKFFNQNGLIIEKIPEGKKLTPDFKGKDKKVLIEVKKMMPKKDWIEISPEIESQINVHTPTKKSEDLSRDSTFNNIRSALENAAKKFKKYEPEHKSKNFIVLFSNSVKEIEVYCVLTGNLGQNIDHKILKKSKVLSFNYKKYIDFILFFGSIENKKPVLLPWKNEEISKYLPKDSFDKISLYCKKI